MQQMAMTIWKGILVITKIIIHLVITTPIQLQIMIQTTMIELMTITEAIKGKKIILRMEVISEITIHIMIEMVI